MGRITSGKSPAASARQFGQDIASIQRLGSRSEPLGAGGRTAPAAIVDRQLQNLQQCLNLAPRYRMGRIWIDGGHEVAKGIQRGEPAWEKIVKDRAFMEAGRDPKAHLEGSSCKLSQRTGLVDDPDDEIRLRTTTQSVKWPSNDRRWRRISRTNSA